MRPYFEQQTKRLRLQASGGFSFPEHLHTHAELFYLFEGQAFMLVGGQMHTLCAGDLCIAFPGVVHGYQEGENARGLMVIFSPDVAPDFAPMLSHFHPNAPLLRREELPEDVMFCMRHMLMHSDEQVQKGYLQVVLAHAMPLLDLTGRTTQVSDIVYRMLKYLSTHFTEPVTVDSLSRELGVSRSYISHTFSQRLGTNFRTYVNTLRADQACSLLRSADLSVTEIAYECGFETQRTFNRVFSELYQMTPSEYRKTHRG